MNRIILICLYLLSVTLTLNAQDEKKSKINSIKKSDKYIYAEATLPTLEDAYALAEEMLHNNINEWVDKNKKMVKSPNIILRNTTDEWSKIDLPRGNMYRAFIYVAKADIIPADNVVILEKPEAVEVNREVAPNSNVSTDIPSNVLSEILSISSFSDIEPCLVMLKRENKISDYNKYSAISNKEDYCMIVYNREGQVEALLSSGAERINLRTNQSDNLSNYKGCGAICFKVKK